MRRTQLAWLGALLATTACSFRPGVVDEFAGDDAQVVDGPGSSDAIPITGDASVADAVVPPDAPPVPADAPPTLQCPATYTLTNAAKPGSKYRHVTASANWATAEADCEDDGGGALSPTHLAVLDDDAERIWIYSQGTTDKWIGASDRVTEGTLRAVTDQPDPFFGTVTGNDNGKDCLTVTQNGTLMENCNPGRPYICECDGRAANPANF